MFFFSMVGWCWMPCAHGAQKGIPPLVSPLDSSNAEKHRPAPPRDPVQTTKPNCLTASICTTLRAGIEDWEETTKTKFRNLQSGSWEVREISKTPWVTRNKHIEHYWTNKTKWDFNLKLVTWGALAIKKYKARPEWVTRPAEHTLR